MPTERRTWIQPRSQDELLSRLADARDLNVPERERENLCACAYSEIERLRKALEAYDRQANKRFRESDGAALSGGAHE